MNSQLNIRAEKSELESMSQFFWQLKIWAYWKSHLYKCN